MSSRKPWEIPIQYREERWSDPEPPDADSGAEEKGLREVEALLARDFQTQAEREYECNDTSPIDYNRGPHDDVIDLTGDLRSIDQEPIDYGRGPHDTEFGVDDDDFEDAGDEPEFEE